MNTETAVVIGQFVAAFVAVVIFANAVGLIWLAVREAKEARRERPDDDEIPNPFIDL